MKKCNQLKIIAFSLCVMITGPAAWAGLGGLQVKSSLGEPFSGSITVTGDEAKVLLKNGKPSVSGAPLRTQVVRQGNNAVIRLHSNQAVRDPLFSFALSVGNQGRQYTALLDPPNYQAASARHDASEAGATRVEPLPQSASSRHRKESKSAHADSAHHSRHGSSVRKDSESAPVLTGRRYTVKTNENLIDVARRVQPKGLSLAQTMRALVRANPRAFRHNNPDLLYKNSVLIIPTAEKMRQLVNVKSLPKTSASAPAKSQPVAAPKAPTPVAPAPVEQQAAPAPVEQAAPVKPKPQPATVPEAPAAQASAPEVAAASAAASAPAAQPVQQPAAQPVQQPAAQPTPAPAPAPVPAPEEEGGFFSGWHGYAILGVAGILLILALLWWRRRQTDTAQDAEEQEIDEEETLPLENDDDVVIVDVSHDSPQPVSKAAAAQVEPKPQTQPQATTASEDEPQQTPQAPETAIQTSDDDWSWLDEDDTSAPSTAVPVADSKTAAQPKATVEPTAETAKVSDEDWLKFDVNQPLNETHSEPATDNKAADDTSTDDDVMEWLAEPADVAQPVMSTSTSDDNTADKVSQAPQNQPAADDNSLDNLQWNDLSFDTDTSANTSTKVLAEKTAATQAKPAAAAESTAPESATYTRNHVLDPQHQNAFASTGDAVTEDIDWNALGLATDEPADTPAAVQSAPAASAPQKQPVQEDVADDGAIEFSVVPEVKKAEVVKKPTPVAEPQHHEVVNKEAAVRDASPVQKTQKSSEQSPAEPKEIDTSVPMRAKLELAKMYLEIDDAVTARNTLRELLDEANGEVLTEAQQLLHQLDG